MVEWLEFPTTVDDESKLTTAQEIFDLGEKFLEMMFTFKHRGAIEKSGEVFSVFLQKLSRSCNIKLQKFPDSMLEKVLERITTESLSQILRRSAGIPPAILAILRAEPSKKHPVLLERAMTFLLDVVSDDSSKEDSKIHALNIMRFIF